MNNRPRIAVAISVCCFVTITAPANPIFTGDLDERPLTSENVTVRFSANEAIVEGVYVFDTSDRHLWPMQMILPVVAEDSAVLEGSAVRFRVGASGNLFGVQQEPEFREAYPSEDTLAAGLPEGTKLIFANWRIGAVDSTKRSVITISYRQPLHDGVFYYLPLTKRRLAEPDTNSEKPNNSLVMNITAEPGYDVSLAEPTNGAIWTDGSVTIYLKHRNLIAAKPVRRANASGRPAQWFEVVEGVRRCAAHKTQLQMRTVSVDKEWRHIFAVHLEPYEDCPNALLETLPAFTDRAHVELSYESCATCEELTAKRSVQHAAGNRSTRDQNTR